MSRRFAGNAYIQFDIPSGSEAYAFGSWFVIFKRNSTGWNGIANLHNTARTQAGSGIELSPTGDGNRMYLGHYTSSFQYAKDPIGVVNADGWVAFVITDATGSTANTTRYHRRAAGSSGTWSHGNMDVALSNASGGTRTVTMVLGSWEGSDFFDGWLAAFAWAPGVNYSDSDIETAMPNSTAIEVADLMGMAGMVHVTQFNQASTGTAVVDLMGNGMTQIAISNTAVDAADDPTGFVYYTAGGSTDLVPAKATHGLTSQTPTLVQSIPLVPANAVHGLTSQAPALVQQHTLAPSKATHGLTSQAPALVQQHTLAPSKATHGLTSTNVTIVPAGSLAPANALHSLTSQAPALVQQHTLAPSKATHGLTSTTVSLSGEATLAPAKATHALTSQSPALVVNLAAAGAVHLLSSTTVTLTQLHQLAAAGARHELRSTAVVLGGLPPAGIPVRVKAKVGGTRPRRPATIGATGHVIVRRG